LITRRTSQSSKLLRVRSPDYSLSRRPQLGCDPAPLQKMTRPCARVLCSRAVSVGNAGSRCGNPGRPGRADVARPGLFVDRSYVPCAGQRYCAAISGALSTRPNVDGVAGRIQRSELLPSRDACGLSNRARRTPVRGGVASATVANVGVGAFRRRGTLVSESACAHTGAVHGLWIRFSHA